LHIERSTSQSDNTRKKTGEKGDGNQKRNLNIRKSDP